MFRKDFLLGVILSLVLMPLVASAQPAPEPPSVAEQDAQSLLSAFASYTDLRIRSVQQSLEILAATPEAGSGKWDKIKGLLSGYQNSDGGFIVWYARPDGSFYTVDKGLVDVKASDRSYFPDLMAGKKVAGILVIGKSTGQRSAVIAVPVLKDGKVVGSIGASLFLDRLTEQANTALALRPSVTFFALAPSGVTALHSKPDRLFLDLREQHNESLTKAVNQMLSGRSGEVIYKIDNASKKTIYRTSPLTQWKYAIEFTE
ncbi:MAG TPA: cache domain-containing protein [Gallionella sp.]|nr:cache domain-containing protein [Gallionella sp.]